MGSRQIGAESIRVVTRVSNEGTQSGGDAFPEGSDLVMEVVDLGVSEAIGCLAEEMGRPLYFR